MATIITRETGATAKGSPLTNLELDTNFINLNTELGQKLSLTGGTMTGAITFAAGQTWPTFNQNTTGSAATLTTGRTIGMTGDVTWTSAAFNGSGNVTGIATLANSGVTAGTYGNATNIPQLTVDAKGRITSVTNTAVSIPSGSLTFTGDVTGTGTTGASTALTLANSGVTAGAYGSASAIPIITVDAKGRVTALSTAALDLYTKLNLTGGTMTGAITFAAGQTWPTFNQNTTGSSTRTESLVGAGTAGIIRITNPDGGTIVGSSSTTGAIKISLPTSGTALNSMLRMRLEVFDYAASESFTMYIAGYLTAAGAWSVQTVTTIASNNNRNFTVRFGSDATNKCIWIGELTDTWSYLKGYISELEVSYNGTPNIANWNTGWSTSFVTAFDTVEDTISGTLPVAKSALTADALNTANSYTVNGLTSGTSITIGTGGTYVAGSIYSDSNWGMLFRAKQASPAVTQFKWADSTDVELMRLATGGVLTIPGTLNAAGGVSSITGTSRVTINTDSGGNISLGRIDGTASSPYIDFNSGTTAVDFDVRIQVTGGNGTAANGTINIQAANLQWNGTNLPKANGTGASGTWGINVTGSSASCTGNAATATTLQTARTINGISFDGSANISIRAFTGTGNDYNTVGAEMVGNGSTNTVFPGIGFHQPGLYASSIQLRGGADFRLYAQGGTTYANLTCNAVTAATATFSSGITTGTGSSWLSQMTDASVIIKESNTEANGSTYRAFVQSRNSTYTYTLGRLSNATFGLYGYINTRTANGTDFSCSMDSAGNWTATGNVTAYSDDRLKKNWKSLENNFIESLSSVKSGTYSRIDSDIRQIGVSAQSLQAIMPEAIVESSDGILSVSYGNAALAAAVELAKELVKLKEEVAILKAQLNNGVV